VIETPRVELPSLLAQSDQVVRMGVARVAARDTVERADQDYELELHTKERSEEVIEAERISATDGRGKQPDERYGKGHRHGKDDDDDPDGDPHLVDVTA
jgi:hypothetical protein